MNLLKMMIITQKQNKVNLSRYYYIYYLNLYYLLTITYFIDILNFQHEESDKESDSDDEDNLELDNPEQSTSYHHQTRSKTAATTIQPTQDVLK